jgi:hypothetical protein
MGLKEPLFGIITIQKINIEKYNFRFSFYKTNKNSSSRGMDSSESIIFSKI